MVKFIYPHKQARYSELLAVLYSELYLQYDSCDITTYSAYNLTYSAYSEITRKLFGLHCQWSGGALSDEGDGVAAMRSGP